MHQNDARPWNAERSTKQKLKSKYERISGFESTIHFTTHGFNVRNNEIGALIGLSQLKRLDEMIEKRNRNFSYFVERLPNWAYKDFDLKGQSNYAFNIILKDADDELMERLENTLRANEIEYRRGSAGGGNQLRQPYVRSIDKFKKIDSKEAAPVTDHIHFYGLYLGNYPNLEKEEIDEILGGESINGDEIKYYYTSRRKRFRIKRY